jgi:hypothetical protein
MRLRRDRIAQIIASVCLILLFGGCLLIILGKSWP